MINEKLFQKIAIEVESDQGWGGLTGDGNMYYEYAKEIAIRYLEQSLHLTPAALDSEGDAVLEGDVYQVGYVESDKITLTRCQ